MQDFTFLYYKNAIYLILGIVLCVVIVLGYKRKKGILEYFHMTYSRKFIVFRIVLFSLSIVMIIFSLMGPMKESGVREVKGSGLEIFILIDTSKSMLVEDIIPSRIERSKNIIQDFIESINGDKIGFIPFASSAYIQMPLTDDYQMANMFVDVMDTDMMSGGGSNVEAAINLAISAFSKDDKGDHIILILSDGEEHSSSSLDTIAKLKESNTKVYSIGVGTLDGGLIPEYEQGIKAGYKKDQSGATIMSKLNEELLADLAVQSGGKYFKSSVSYDELQLLMTEFDQLNQSSFEVRSFKEYDHLYQYSLSIAVILLLLALLLPERRLQHE